MKESLSDDWRVAMVTLPQPCGPSILWTWSWAVPGGNVAVEAWDGFFAVLVPFRSRAVTNGKSCPGFPPLLGPVISGSHVPEPGCVVDSDGGLSRPGRACCLTVPPHPPTGGLSEIAQWTDLSLGSNGKVIKPFWVHWRAGFSLGQTAFEKIHPQA